MLRGGLSALDFRHLCVLVSPQISCVSSAPPDISLGLASRIRQARDAAVLTQQELAGHLGVSERTLQNWEAGTVPRAKQRRRVLAWLEERAA